MKCIRSQARKTDSVTDAKAWGNKAKAKIARTTVVSSGNRMPHAKRIINSDESRAVHVTTQLALMKYFAV